MRIRWEKYENNMGEIIEKYGRNMGTICRNMKVIWEKY
jgi:hypothetical protein